jgi:hypothetical protein
MDSPVGEVGVLGDESVLGACGWLTVIPARPIVLVPVGAGSLGDVETVEIEASLYERVQRYALSQDEANFHTHGFRALSPGMALAIICLGDPEYLDDNTDLVVDADDARAAVVRARRELGFELDAKGINSLLS